MKSPQSPLCKCILQPWLKHEHHKSFLDLWLWPFSRLGSDLTKIAPKKGYSCEGYRTGCRGGWKRSSWSRWQAIFIGIYLLLEYFNHLEYCDTSGKKHIILEYWKYCKHSPSWGWVQLPVCVLCYYVFAFWREVMGQVIMDRPGWSPGITTWLTITTIQKMGKQKSTTDQSGDGYGTSSLYWRSTLDLIHSM